jgi:hypothetical protein
MQTKQVLEIIRRLQTRFSPIHERLAKLQNIIYTPSPQREEEMSRLVIEITYQLGDFIETVQHDSDSVKVLEAFALEELLLKKEFWFGVASRLSLVGSIEGPRDVDRQIHMHREAWGDMQTAFFRPYDRMISCVKPFTTLTIPADLLSEPGEDVLAVNLSDRERLDLKVLAKVIGEVEALYDAVNRVFGRADAAPLQIIKIESGSSLRIDLKGLAGVY